MRLTGAFVLDQSAKSLAQCQLDRGTAFDFVRRMSGVKSPSEFLELWTEHGRKQVETLTEQS
jgi:hypothetical protein